MAIVCLPKELVAKVGKYIDNGILEPEKLRKMTSEARRKLFGQVLGDDNMAQTLNLQFERKLLLKNQERGLYNWVKDITGISKQQKEELLAKIRKTYSDKQSRIYEPAENEKFLDELTSDMFSKKFRTDVSLPEAQIITKMTNNMRVAKSKMNPDFTWNTPEEGLEFGSSKVALDNYVGDLKLEARKIPFISPLKEKGIGGKLRAIGQDLGVSRKFVADNSRSIVASVDNSWWGRQGLKTLITQPKIWGKNFAKSWIDIAKTLRGGRAAGEEVVDGVKAEIYSRKNFLNGLYEKGRKLDIGTGEEAFPTSAPAKIPLFGRVFKASESAYEAGAMRMRADVADKMYVMAENTGIDLSDKFQIGSINELINSMTGRGSLGKIGEGPQAFVNSTFFSIKFFKSNIDTLLLHPFGRGISEFAQKQAIFNLAKIMGAVGTTLGIAKSLYPDSVDFDPRSANFGKIKIGNTRFDLTGGMSSFQTLLARIATRSRKSSQTGVVTKIGGGFGSRDILDTIYDFGENKFAPFTSMLKNIAIEKTFEGEKPTLITEVRGLTTPIIIQEWQSLKDDPNSANMILALMSDAMGFSANTYTFKDNWDIKQSKEMKQFKVVKGDKIFKEANKEYNTKVNNFLTEVVKRPEYERMTDKEKRDLIADVKQTYKDQIFEKNDFEYTGGIPTFDSGDKVEERSIIQTAVLYAKAIGKDPIQAFDIMFDNQTLRKIENNALIVTDMPDEWRVTQKKRLGYKFGTGSDLEMDHIVAQELGGQNEENNLWLIPKQEHARYTKADNYLGSQLRQGIIDRQTAQKLAREMKSGLRTPEEILNMKF